VFKSLFDVGYKELKKIRKVADQIDALASQYSALSDEELKAKTPYFREKLQQGSALEDILIDAYATVREASTRV
jgi:preprotein translocase subunit SecA